MPRRFENAKSNAAPRFYLSMSAIVAFVLNSCIVTSCPAQLTTQQLIGSHVEKLGEEFKEVDDAVAAFQQGKFDAARNFLHAARKKHAELQPAEVMQARLFFSIGQIASAQDALERAVADGRSDPDPFLLLADLAFRQRQFTFAELTYDHAESLLAKFQGNKLREKEMQIRLHAGQSQVAALRGLDDKAIEHLQAWIKLEDKNSIPHSRLAKIYFQKKKYSEARQSLTTLAGLDENLQRVEVLMAKMYDEVGKRDWAKKNMELAIQKGPREPRTRIAVGEWALSVGELKMAEESSAAALKIDPKSTRANVLAGRLARHQEDLKAAEKHLRRALELSPGNFAARNQLVLTLADSDQDEMKRLSVEYAQLNVRSHTDLKTRSGREAAVSFAWVLFKQGREADAEKLIQSAIRGGAISSESAYYVAKIMAQRGKKQAAVQILDPVLAMNRNFPRRQAAKKLLAQLSKAKDE